MESTNKKQSFGKRLKDFCEFKVFITSKLAKELWGFLALCSVLWIFMSDDLDFFKRFLIGALCVLITRIMTELFVVLFSIADLLREIRDK